MALPLDCGPVDRSGDREAGTVIDGRDAEAGPQLVWRVSIDPPDTDLTGATAVDPGSTYYIHANGTDAGTVIRETSNAQALTVGAPASTTANDVLGDSREIDVTRLSLIIFDLDNLHDVTRDISTYRTMYLLVLLGPPITPGVLIYRGLTGWDASAVSAHANMAEVYDYYSTTLGLTSFDGQGAPIVISTEYNPHEKLTDYTDGYENAFWDSSEQQFAFGDSGDLEAAVDVVGHEYTHAVVDYVVGGGEPALDYGESGALNEAYADIMGMLIEGKSKTDEGRWLIGEDSEAGVIRNLADPSSIDPAYRDDYADRYTGVEDEGGEHYNSTIFSHAAYLMMTDERTQDISDATWATLFYQSMAVLSPGATFSDARDAVVVTAGDMDFTEPEIAAIEDAFDEVGIEPGGTWSLPAHHLRPARSVRRRHQQHRMVGRRTLEIFALQTLTKSRQAVRTSVGRPARGAAGCPADRPAASAARSGPPGAGVSRSAEATIKHQPR
jgi:bacillolysin